MNTTTSQYPPLHFELASYLIPQGATERLRHPLVQEEWYHPEQNERLNGWFESNKVRLNEALAAKDWSSAVVLYQRGWRLDRFEYLATESEHAVRMTDEEYWATLRLVIMDQEDCYRQRAAFSRLLVKTNRSKNHRHLLMTVEERGKLVAMPERLAVYRGCQEFNKKGWSWTLDKDKADWFSKRCFRGTPILLSGEVRKDDVLAYIAGRGESEILVQPQRVSGIQASSPGLASFSGA